MASRVVSFRLPEHVYDEFEEACEEAGITPAKKLKQLVSSTCSSGQTDEGGAKSRTAGEVDKQPADADTEGIGSPQALADKARSLERVIRQMDAAMISLVEKMGSLEDRVDGIEAIVSQAMGARVHDGTPPLAEAKSNNSFPLDFSPLFERKA